MKYRLVLLCIVWLLYCPPASSDVLKNGHSIQDAINAMNAAGYGTTVLEMGPPARDEELHFWKVDQGVLIINYSKTTDEIVALNFWFADERPKALRKTFAFNVIAFDTDTGEMTIRTNKSKPSGGSARQKGPRRSK